MQLHRHTWISDVQPTLLYGPQFFRLSFHISLEPLQNSRQKFVFSPVEREAKDMIEILRQFLAMLRFIAELPETLKQLEARERETLERELKKLLQLVEQFKDAIKSLGSSGKKEATVMSRVFRSIAKTTK